MPTHTRKEDKMYEDKKKRRKERTNHERRGNDSVSIIFRRHERNLLLWMPEVFKCQKWKNEAVKVLCQPFLQTSVF